MRFATSREALLRQQVWVSALGTRGLCAELTRLVPCLQERGSLELLIGTAVREEVRRILPDEFGAGRADLSAADAVLDPATPMRPGQWAAPAGFPDPDDTPLVAAALAAGAERFVTGDRALLALGAVEGLRPVDPRAAYIELRGLG